MIVATAATIGIVACIPRPLTTSPAISPVSIPDSLNAGNHGTATSDTSKHTPPTTDDTQDKPALDKEREMLLPRIAVDMPELATASIVAHDEAVKKALPIGAFAAVEIKQTSDATTSVVFALAALAPNTKLDSLQVARQRETADGIAYYETAQIKTVDEARKTITFASRGSGVYVLLPPGQVLDSGQNLPYYEGIRDQQLYQYIPAQDEFVAGGSGNHGPSIEYYSILTDDDIASASVLFNPGDGHDKETGDWHAIKFYRYAYHHAKSEDRAWAWKRMAPMVHVYDTRVSIDKSAEYALPFANMRIGFSYGALRNRAGKAIANYLSLRQAYESRTRYLHHFGDISWAGEHLGIKIADPKAWRAGTQGRPYATTRALAHGAFFHSLSTPLALRPLKNALDPIRELGVSWQAYGHRSFYPPPRRYPTRYPFTTMFRFGFLGDTLLPEVLSPDDAYGLPCAEASEYFKSATENTSMIRGGECRYNFIQALESMGNPREIRYAGFFADISELVRANREFAGLLVTNLADTLQWKDRSAATTRRALAWMQSEQALPPHNLLCGDGLADCASAFGYEGSEPLVRQNGTQIDVNYDALARSKPDGIQYRVIKGATHADFVGKGTDDPHTFTEAERAIYDSTLADLRAYDDAAVPNGTHVLTGWDASTGMRQYLAGLGISDERWSYHSDPVRTGPDRCEFTFFVMVRVPEVGRYINERDDYYKAKFRWYNGRWWFDGEKPSFQYSRSIG